MGELVSGDALIGLSTGQLRRRFLGVALGLIGWSCFRFLASRPELAGVIAGMGPIPAMMRGLSILSAAVPFPLAEAMVVGVALRQLSGAWSGMNKIRRRRANSLGVLVRGGLRLAQDVGVLVFLFYLLWGFQYARLGLEAHLGIEPAGEVTTPELRALAERAVELTNQVYEEIHGSTDIGEPTAARPLADIVPSLEIGWDRVRQELGLSRRVSRPHGSPKRILATPLVKRLGMSGIYFPFTGEALVLGDLPGVLLAKDLGHEMAHQRGFSSESDANVLGTLVAAHSPDPLARYSAYSFLQRQLVSALQRVSTSDAEEVVQKRVPGVRRDLADLAAYWQPAQTPVSKVVSRVNDAMLRTHGISQGIASYEGSTWVFIALARERGADVLFF